MAGLEDEDPSDIKVESDQAKGGILLVYIIFMSTFFYCQPNNNI